MDLPAWLNNVVKSFECSHCGRQLSERSIYGVGVMLAGGGMDVPPTPAARVTICCEHCGCKVDAQMDVPLDEVLEAVRMLHDYGPSIVHPHHGQIEAAPDRGVAALGPLDDLEKRRLLDQLNRMSFNRRTKSFSRWFREIEGDNDVPF